MIERFDVGTPAAAAAFAAGRSRAVLLALAAREQSLRQLADSTGLRLNLLHYHVTRLHKVGLVKVVRTETRPGRPVRIYAAVARAFFVPARLAGAETGERLCSELRELLARARARSDNEGTLYYAGDDGGPRMRRLGGEGAAEGAEFWGLVDLNRGEAAEFAAEMAALLARYRGRGRSARRPYLVHGALAAK